MGKAKDLTGEKFGRLVVVKYAGVVKGHVVYECECSCGSMMTTRGSTLRTGTVNSCGCIKNEILRKSSIARGDNKYPKKMDEREKASYRSRLHRLNREYNLTELDYQELSDNQSGLCPICGRSLDWSSKVPHVDHDHSTGKVRGLLCHQCNVGLGSFRDNIDSLERAKLYIKKNIIR